MTSGDKNNDEKHLFLSNVSLSSIGDRIKQLRGKNPRKSLGLRLEVDPTTIANYETGKRLPPLDFIAKLCDLYSVTLDWLVWGRLPMTQSALDNSYMTGVGSEPALVSKNPTIDSNTKYLQIPLVETELSAGGGSLLDSKNIIKHIEINPEIIKYKGRMNDMVFMTVYGDSMEPIIAHKDLVLINLAQTIPYSGGVFAVAHDFGVYIKRITTEPGKLILRSDNKSYSDIVIDLKDEAAMGLVKIIGRAVWWCHDERL